MTLNSEWRKATKGLDTGCVEVRRVPAVIPLDGESRVPASSAGDTSVEVRRVAR
jgi:hypothetical protein